MLLYIDRQASKPVFLFEIAVAFKIFFDMIFT